MHLDAEPGQSLGYAFGVKAHAGVLYDAYTALCRGEYGFKAYRENVYDTSRLVWCKVTPRAGEGGSVLVTVAVPAPCRDPEGPG